MTIRIEMERDLSIRGYSVWIYEETADGPIKVAKPLDLVFEEVQPRATYGGPTLRFAGKKGYEFLTELATALAAMGFKTNELQNVNQEISAIKYHLEDMRKLVFKSK